VEVLVSSLRAPLPLLGRLLASKCRRFRWPRKRKYLEIEVAKRQRKMLVVMLAVCLWYIVIFAVGNIPPADAHAGAPYWPYAKVLQLIKGAKLHIGRRTLRVDASLVTCTGEDRRRIRNHVAEWRHFVCLEAQLPPKRDITFRVHPLGRRAFVITDAHFGY
jgi:hypothetical protein